MKILITGSNGQLGKALIKSKPTNHKIFAMNRSNFDMLNISECLKLIKELKPDWIINCGAYTNVDLAESEEETVMKINFYAPKAFAEEMKKSGGGFLQISTDYVFNGKNKKTPYTTTEKRSPLGIYGLTKAKAEQSIEDIFEDSNLGIILRTSWLISPFCKNFLLTILNLHQNNKEIKVVNDQIGSTTNVFNLAEVCWKIIGFKDHKILKQKSKNGILHWQDEGETTWYKVALSISNIGRKLGLIESSTEIIPVKTNYFNTCANRPLYSVLECNSTKSILNLKNIYWEHSIEKILKQIYLDSNNRYSFNPMHKI